MTELQPRNVGRPCATCEHSRRAAIEADMLSGDRIISSVSSEYGISIAALRRHRAQHMSWTADDIRQAGLDPVDLVVRLGEIAERLQDAAEAAEEAGRVSDMVRASDGQRRAIQTLLDQGVKSEDLVARLDRSWAYLRAVARLARRDAVVGEAVAAELEAAGRVRDAQALRELFPETTSREALTA